MKLRNTQTNEVFDAQENEDFAADMRECFADDDDSEYRIDKWYDKSSGLWIITIQDRKNNQIGDAEFAAGGDTDSIDCAVEYLDSEIIKLSMIKDYSRS